MRPSCTNCARKHLAQALILLQESRQGYPLHHWLAIGHMAEASDELVREWPASARTIRDARKKVEANPLADIDFLGLIDHIGSLGLVQAPQQATPEQKPVVPTVPTILQSTTPISPSGPLVANGVVPPLVVTQGSGAPCSDCDFKKLVTGAVLRYMSEQAEIGPGKRFRGRLVIMTTLGDFVSSYSLVSVIIDQARAAVLAGLRVDLWVNQGCNTTNLPKFPYGVTVVPMMPPVRFQEDIIHEPGSALIAAAIDSFISPLTAHGEVTVIAHDLLLQSWFVTAAHALHHHIGDRYKDRVRWWHMTHSSVNGRLRDSDTAGFVNGLPHPHWYRSHVPTGHRLLSVNATDVPALSYYYHTPIASIDILQNSRDPISTLDLDPTAALLASKHGLLEADIVQVFPVSADRLLDKGAAELVRLFAFLENHTGQRVRLVFATAHANGERGRQQIDMVKRAAVDAGLSPEALVFTSESLNATTGHGLDQHTIRGLLAISNLFAFPTVSEAASLVLWEASLAGCLLVLNASLPCLQEQVPVELATWFVWPSNKSPGVPSPNAGDVADLAGRIVDLLAHPAYALRRHAFHAASLGRYAERLLAVLGVHAPA